MLNSDSNKNNKRAHLHTRIQLNLPEFTDFLQSYVRHGNGQTFRRLAMVYDSLHVTHAQFAMHQTFFVVVYTNKRTNEQANKSNWY